MAAAGVQGQGRLGQEEEEEDEEEDVARVVPAAWVPAPHQLHQGGWLLVTIPSSCQLFPSSLPTGAQAPLAHVSGAESLLAHRETVHF